MNTESDLLLEIMREIVITLGYTEANAPTQIPEDQVAKVLDIKSTTLGNWRCTGRYHLPYIKTGRLVRYRIADLAAWIAKRRTGAKG